MSFPKFRASKNQENARTPATVATVATRGEAKENKERNVAGVANVATHISKNAIFEAWHDAITGWQPTTPDMIALKETAIQFLSSEWAERAIEDGWNKVDLFGLFPNVNAARYRYGTWGLVTHLGLSIHKPTLVELSEGRATLRTAAGATQTKFRVLPEEEISRPFWECWS